MSRFKLNKFGEIKEINANESSQCVLRFQQQTLSKKKNQRRHHLKADKELKLLQSCPTVSWTVSSTSSEAIAGPTRKILAASSAVIDSFLPRWTLSIGSTQIRQCAVSAPKENHKKKKCIEREKKTVSALRKPSVINEDPSRGAAPLKTGYTTRNKSPNRRPWPNSTRLSLTAFYLATAVSRLSVPPISGSRRFPAIHARLHGGDPFVAVISAAESRRAPGRRRGCLPCFVFFFLFGSCKSPRMSCLSCHRHHLSTLDGAPLVPTVFHLAARRKKTTATNLNARPSRRNKKKEAHRASLETDEQKKRPRLGRALKNRYTR